MFIKRYREKQPKEAQTTTSNFDGIKIIEYLEPVTSHVVIGMNIFKDFITSLSDVFGGNSGTYEKTLADINQKAISLLKSKAKNLGGNCIIGLKIDNDEISAKGKSMLMVTAVGTVAIADFPINEAEKNKIETNKLISKIEPNITVGEEEQIQKENAEKELIAKYNISFYDDFYHYQNYKYNTLKDAVNYAELVERNKK